MTKDFSYYLMDVGVAYREDVDEVIAVLREVDADLRRDPEFGPDILDDLDVVGVDDFAASQGTIKVRIKTVLIKQWWVGRELRRRIKKAFDTQGIEIPFPHLTPVLWGTQIGERRHRCAWHLIPSTCVPTGTHLSTRSRRKPKP
jgi:moderate conductance mechanosensitive channel